MNLNEREFTTEEIAQFCGVSRPAVVEWISKGLLAARLTEGRHRRVSRSALAAFLTAQGYRIPVEVAREKPLVFVIDDEPVWRATIQAQLEPLFEVLTYAQGIEVLLACGHLRPDAIVFDMHMPGMDGMQLLDAITKAPVLNETRFVALTEHDEEISAARRSGAHIALPKTRSEDLQSMLIKNVSEAQRRPLPGKARAAEDLDATAE